MDPSTSDGLRFVDEQSVSSLDVTDLTTPQKVKRSASLTGAPVVGGKSKFLSLTLRRRKVSLDQEVNLSLSEKKPKAFKKTSTGLMRILSFGKSSKKKPKLKKEGLTSGGGAVTDEEDFGSYASLDRARLNSGSQGDPGPGDDVLCNNLLRNPKKSPEIGSEEVSTDSFKSAEVSPELHNASRASEQSPVDGATGRGVSTSSTEVTESVDSDKSSPSQLKKKSVLRLLRRGKKSGVLIHSKTPSDLKTLPTSASEDEAAHVGATMSHPSGAIRKEGKPRGRGAVEKRKEKKDEPDEEVLKRSAIIGQQLLQQKTEEGEKKVTGDDLRKQLTEGLRTNGNGRKEQIRSITRPVVEKTEAETSKFIEQEKEKEKEKEEKTIVPPVEPIPQGTGNEETAAAPVAEMQLPEAAKGEMAHTDGKREHLYKILVIGELGTGKTSIIKRYVHQFFSQHYRATIGVDFALKVLNWDHNTIIRLQLWDIAGQERFGNMTRVYYKEAVGAFIVFDVTRAATFDAVLKWKMDLDSKVQLSDGSPIPCILLANKCDQPKEGIVNYKGKMDEFCNEKGFATWFETSAKENINIEEAAKTLVTKILQNDKLVQNGEQSLDKDKFGLDRRAEASAGKGCSC